MLITKLHNNSKHCINKHILAGTQGIPLENYIKTSKHKLKKLLIANPTTMYGHNKSYLYLIKLYRSINTLKANRSIIIKPTDKNLGIAIINIADYKKAGYNKLDSANYLKINDFNMDEIVKDLIRRLLKLQILSTNININNLDYSLPMNWTQFSFDLQYERAAHLIMYYFSHPDLLKLCRLYLTPKVHKIPLGWREICANPKWLTSIASNSVHIMLYPLLIKLPSYIESSTELICQIKDSTFNDECVLLQADIENMYPSIDTQDGLSTLHKILEIDNTYDKHQQNIIINLTEWVHTNNYYRSITKSINN